MCVERVCGGEGEGEKGGRVCVHLFKYKRIYVRWKMYIHKLAFVRKC